MAAARRSRAVHCESTKGDSASSSTFVMEKPDSHRRREYELLELPNGLKAILASDPSCDKASAALCVGVGRLHEPKSMPGLAHFCEHMLFLGTERFPDEAEYKRFIKRHGGKCNASTGDATTCYAFDIAPEHLGGALDRFSNFFLTPLFTPSATDREINAVDSEHSMRLTDDGRRSYATLLLDANPAHPLHWGSGNAKSLRDEPRARGVDLHAEVVRFWREQYSAEDMTLAVLGSESLSDLRQMVTERFSAVRTTGTRATKGDAHGGDELAIRRPDFRGLILREPSKDKRTIDFDWQLPDWQVRLWSTKPTAYASYLIGHEGKGSLLSALKERGWATSLSAGSSDFGSFSLFNVSITLTEKGLDNVKEVGEMLFSYIRLLQIQSIQSWVLDEMKLMRSVRFRFADDVQPYSLVNRIAQGLQNYPAAHVLSAASMLPTTDAQASAAILDTLSAESVRVELAAKRFKADCTGTDPWYGGPYAPRTPVPVDWQQCWAKAASAPSAAAEVRAAALGLEFARPNPFLPEDLSLKDVDVSARLPIPLPLPAGHPPSIVGYHRQDDTFMQPKAICGFHFHCPSAAEDAASYLRTQLWCNALMEELNEHTYDASSAGLGYGLSAVPGGMELTIGGFVDKLPVLLRTVTAKMRGMSEVSERTFSIVRDRFERSLKNTVFKQRPCDLAGRKSRDVRFSLSFPAEERLEVLHGMTAKDVAGQGARLLNGCRVEALSMGNLRAADSARMISLVTEELGLHDAGDAPLPSRGEVVLPPGRTLWRFPGPNPEDPNNAVRCEIQLPLSVENSVGASLFTRVLSPRFFEELRTKQQLGYIVQMSFAEREGSIAILFTVQTEYPPEFVRSRIDMFLQNNMQWLESDFEDSEFVRQRAGIVSNLAEAPKNLNEEFGRHWYEVERRRFNFARREQKRDAVERATLADLRRFVGTVRDAPRLYVEVLSTHPGEGKAATEEVSATPPDRLWEGFHEAAAFRDQAHWVSLDTTWRPPGADSAAREAGPRAKM